MLKANNPSDQKPIVDLRALGITFWRERWIVAGCLSISIAVGLALAFSAETYYRGTALLFVSPSDPQVGIPSQVGQGLAAVTSGEEIINELGVLQTRQVYERVVENLNLLQNPQINPFLDDGAPEGVFAFLRRDGENVLPPEDVQARVLATIVRGSTSVRRRGLSRVVEIDVTQNDPILAADIANAVAQAHIAIRQEEVRASIRDAAEWLTEQVVELEGKAQASAAAAATFRTSAGIGDVRQIEGLSVQLSQLNANLEDAEEDRRSVSQRLEALPEDDARRAGLESTLQSVLAREAALDASVADISARLEELSRANIQLLQLEQQASADRFIYERFLEQSLQNVVLETLPIVSTRVLEPAVVPLSADGPSKKLILAIAVFVGGALGVGIVFLREVLNSSVRSRDELAELTRLPVVASLPMLPRGRTLLERHLGRENKAQAIFNEELRGFRNSILPPDEGPGRVVALTSTVQGEGKTTLSLELAKAIMALGLRAVVVDCDQRRSRMSDVLDLTGDIGISDVLAGKHAVLDAVQIDPTHGIHIVPMKRNVRSDPDLLALPHFTAAMRDLRQIYDVIILDTPPLAPVSDISTLSRHCDDVYFLCQWKHTKREQVTEALERLELFGDFASGAILTKVNFRKEAAFRGSSYYRYEEYLNA